MSVSLTMQVNIDIPHSPPLLKGLGNLAKDAGVDIKIWLQDGRTVWDWGFPSIEELESQTIIPFMVITAHKEYLFLTQSGMINITDHYANIVKDIRAMPILECKYSKYEYQFEIDHLLEIHKTSNRKFNIWGVFHHLEAAEMFKRRVEHCLQKIDILSVTVEEIICDPKEKGANYIQPLMLPGFKYPNVEHAASFHVVMVEI